MKQIYFLFFSIFIVFSSNIFAEESCLPSNGSPSEANACCHARGLTRAQCAATQGCKAMPINSGSSSNQPRYECVSVTSGLTSKLPSTLNLLKVPKKK